MSHQRHRRIVSGRWSVVRRVSAVALLAGSCVVATSATASASPSRGGCPNAPHWSLTDAASWRAMSELGVIQEFGSMEAGATMLGFPSPQALRAAFDETFAYVDAIAPGVQEDGWICVSSVRPPGLPAFLFSVHNNKFRS